MEIKPRKTYRQFQSTLSSPEQRLKFLISVLVAILCFSTVGYKLLEGGSWLDAFYMSVITIATVGFKEVYALNDPTKIFTIIVIAFSVVILAYTVGTLGQFLVEGELREILGRRKMEKKIREMKNHFIVVGYGRVGQMVHSEFMRQNVECVVIENDEEILQQMGTDRPLMLVGSAIEDEVLLSAGIESARGLVNTIPHEADAVYITLTARQLNSKLFIIARADSKGMEKKLSRAGADKIVSPYEIGGKRMAMASLRPNVVDFMTIESISGQLGLSIEEVEVFSDAKIVGSSLKETDLRSKYGVTVIGIKKPSGDLQLDPVGDTKVDKGDILILIGKVEALEKLQNLTKS